MTNETAKQMVERLWIHRQCFKDGQFQADGYFQYEQLVADAYEEAARVLCKEADTTPVTDYAEGWRDGMRDAAALLEQMARELRQ